MERLPSDEGRSDQLRHCSLLQCVRSQLCELDLLQSMYPGPSELAIDDGLATDQLRQLVAQCDAASLDAEAAEQLLAECQCRIGFTFRVSLLAGASSVSSGSRTLDCVCRLPAAYPMAKPPGLFLRSDWLSRDQLRLASEALAAQVDATFRRGEPVLYELLSWLGELVASLGLRDLQAAAAPTAAGSGAGQSRDRDPLCRLWIHSHHIYSSLKRQDIVSWSQELGLTGFSIVGKPGIVCVEGPESQVEEFWQRLRRLNWKRLTLKEKEVCPRGAPAAARFRRFADFRERGFDARPGRGREVLQDWGLVVRFLEGAGLGHVIPLYFGNIRSGE